MNWFVRKKKYLTYFQKCCFPSEKEAIIKEEVEVIDEDNNNTKINSDNNCSKYI